MRKFAFTMLIVAGLLIAATLTIPSLMRSRQAAQGWQPAQYPVPNNTEAYDVIADNGFMRASDEPLATFSIDVDTASYSNVRRFLSMNQMPPKDAVRIEEFINYFTYDYPPAIDDSHPIAVHPEVAVAPWNSAHRLARIGIKAKDIDLSQRPPSNLVFLIDISGSMATPEKLPLLRSAMKLLVDQLTEADHVAIVTYAGDTGVRLRSTSGDRKDRITAAIDSLEAGGSTNGGAGIMLAYEMAASNFIPHGTNRVILATDGDFNVGITDQAALVRLIQEKARSGVFLTVLGFGMGNYKDSTLEKLADAGNGNYGYIDTLNEARKSLVEQVTGTLITVAKDVKVQVEFNPLEVESYRLIGYEDRILRAEDFNDDQKDAGDMGAGHTVTALFEIVPSEASSNGELLKIKVRYKDAAGETSRFMEMPVASHFENFDEATGDFRFAAAVAAFGMVLRDSPDRGESTFDAVLQIAERSKGVDKSGYRSEFLELVRKARSLKQ